MILLFHKTLIELINIINTVKSFLLVAEDTSNHKFIVKRIWYSSINLKAVLSVDDELLNSNCSSSRILLILICLLI
jgi:hypothetical protein